MDSNLKTTIKHDINLFCKDLLNVNDNQMINNPVIIAIYLGQESEESVNASLKDAFTSSFSIDPEYSDICINTPHIDSQYLLGEMMDKITALAEQGKNYNDLRFIFIGLMHDSFFNQIDSSFVDVLKDALNQLEDMNISTTQTAFYGLFNQKKLKANYKNAFNFVNNAKKLIRNIYHIEVPFTAKDYHHQAQLIALHSISNNYSMIQTKQDEYQWDSIALHSLRIPEFFTASVLHDIYRRQLDDREIDLSEWKDNIKKVLAKHFSMIINDYFTNCFQYVPLVYVEPQPKKKVGFFSFRKQEEADEVYRNVLLDANEMKVLCDDVYGELHVQDEQYNQILEEMICSSTSVAKDGDKVEEILVQMLNDEKNELEYSLNTLSQVNSEHIVEVNRYLKEKFENEKTRAIYKKKIQIVQGLIEKIQQDETVNHLIKDIIEKNNAYTLILKELCINEYGGIMDEVVTQNLPTFMVNLSVKHILEKIDRKEITKLINDQHMMINRLDAFLHRTIHVDIKSHNLGQLNENYNNIQPIQYKFLMTPSLENSGLYRTVLNNHSNLIKDINELYRENTFFVISRRPYDSEHYIIRYQRGE